MKKIFSLLLALALCAGLSVPAFAAGFSDVPPGHYAASAIDACVAKGVASGYSDGSFKPAAPVTRAQFCVMIARAFYPEELGRYETAENKAAGWFVPAVECLYNQAYDGGALESTSFVDDCRNPAVMNQPINRYDAAKILWFCTPPEAPFLTQAQREQAQSKIADWDSVPDQYYYPVSDCFALGVITGLSDGTFGGYKTLNRGQACAIIYRMLSLANGGTIPQPSIPAQGGSGTLANGKPITEENVLEMLYELYAKYPGSTAPGASTYTPVGQSISTKVYAPFFGGGSVNARECAGWAALVSDYIFGKDAPVRVHTNYYNCKPGDILYLLPEGGGHKSLVIDAIYTNGLNGGQDLMYLTTDSGSSHMVDWGWDFEPGSMGSMLGTPSGYSSWGFDVKVITRYPDDSPSLIVKDAPPPLHASSHAPAGSKASRDHSALNMYS